MGELAFQPNWKYNKHKEGNEQKGNPMATLQDLAEQIHEALVDSLDEEDYKEFRWSVEAMLPLIIELRERL